MQMMMMLPMLKKFMAPARKRRRQSSYSSTAKKRCAKGYRKKCYCVKSSGSTQKSGTQKKKKSTQKSQNVKSPGSAFLSLNKQLQETQDSFFNLTQTQSGSMDMSNVSFD